MSGWVLRVSAAFSFSLSLAACRSQEATQDTGTVLEPPAPTARSGPSLVPDAKDPEALVDERTTGRRLRFHAGSLSTPPHSTHGILSFQGFPNATAWKVGSASGVTQSFSQVDVGDLLPRMGSVSATDYQGQFQNAPLDLGLRLELTLPGEGSSTVKLPGIKLYPHALAGRLLEVPFSAIRFDGEAPDDPKKRIGLVVFEDHVAHFGDSGSLSEVDLIVTARPGKSRPPVPCRYLEGPLDLVQLDYDVSLYDRRSGEKRDSKVFPSESKCPAQAWAQQGAKVQPAIFPLDAVLAYAKSKLKA